MSEVTQLSVHITDEAIADAIAYFQNKAKQRSIQPSPDDLFIGGLTYRDYFLLSDEESDALWDKLEAEAPGLEGLPIVDVTCGVEGIPSRKRYESY